MFFLHRVERGKYPTMSYARKREKVQRASERGPCLFSGWVATRKSNTTGCFWYKKSEMAATRQREN